jgi:hypothetical protein
MLWRSLKTLWYMVIDLGATDEVANELGIKKSSLKRQMNRIEAYYEGKGSQKRSGIERGNDYLNAMQKVVERRTGQPILTHEIQTNRILKFRNLWDLIRYREPIAHISTIYYAKGEDAPWELYIAINSEAI